MDWFKMFILLLTMTSSLAHAEGSRKKIRIHIPQKVKHIHHHKKIYITQHPATAQYAPAFLPTAEGSVAIPATAAVPFPTVAGLVPLKPIPYYEERTSSRLHGINAAHSQLLPQYRARGYYGPSPKWEHPNYDIDLVPPPGPAAGPTNHGMTAPSAPGPSPTTNYKNGKGAPKKKKVIRKKKPKRILIQELTKEDGGESMSSFHEQFYADVDAAGTIKKVKKPKRVEKIIDGDTEHIHTYSEEHIHKIVFDDQQAKLAGLAGLEQAESALPGIIGANALLPLKNSHGLLAYNPGVSQNHNTPLRQNVFASMGSIGSLGTPAHLEYAGYNSKDVTHDHMYHDHGLVPNHVDISGQNLGTPPRVSYNSQGHKINLPQQTPKRHKNKWVQQENNYAKPPLALNDLSYYESMYSHQGSNKNKAPYYGKYNDDGTINASVFDNNNYKPGFRPRQKVKNYGIPTAAQHPYHKKPGGIRNEFSYPSASFHDVGMKVPNPPRTYYGSPGTLGIQNYKDSYSSLGISNYKDPYTSIRSTYPRSFGLDNFASSSDNLGSDISSWFRNGSTKKKSISTQNISFGGQDHKTIVDHLGDSSNIQSVIQPLDESSTQYKGSSSNVNQVNATPHPDYTVTEYPPTHDYYTSMAIKTFRENPIEVPDASNDNYQIVEAPTSENYYDSMSPTPMNDLSMAAEETTIRSTTAPFINTPRSKTLRKSKGYQHKERDTDTVSIKPRDRLKYKTARRDKTNTVYEYSTMTSNKENNQPIRIVNKYTAPSSLGYQRPHTQRIMHIPERQGHQMTTTERGKFKYGDKLQDQ